MPGKSLSEVVERCSLNNIIFLRRELKVRLEMGHIYIKDIQFASESRLKTESFMYPKKPLRQ
jgi:hypothetical protein